MKYTEMDAIKFVMDSAKDDSKNIGMFGKNGYFVVFERTFNGCKVLFEGYDETKPIDGVMDAIMEFYDGEELEVVFTMEELGITLDMIPDNMRNNLERWYVNFRKEHGFD